MSGSANVLWFLSTHGNGRYLGTTAGARPVDLAYLRQAVRRDGQDLRRYRNRTADRRRRLTLANLRSQQANRSSQ